MSTPISHFGLVLKSPNVIFASLRTSRNTISCSLEWSAHFRPSFDSFVGFSDGGRFLNVPECVKKYLGESTPVSSSNESAIKIRLKHSCSDVELRFYFSKWGISRRSNTAVVIFYSVAIRGWMGWGLWQAQFTLSSPRAAIYFETWLVWALYCHQKEEETLNRIAEKSGVKARKDKGFYARQINPSLCAALRLRNSLNFQNGLSRTGISVQKMTDVIIGSKRICVTHVFCLPDMRIAVQPRL